MSSDAKAGPGYVADEKSARSVETGEHMMATPANLAACLNVLNDSQEKLAAALNEVASLREKLEQQREHTAASVPKKTIEREQNPDGASGDTGMSETTKALLTVRNWLRSTGRELHAEALDAAIASVGELTLLRGNLGTTADGVVIRPGMRLYPLHPIDPEYGDDFATVKMIAEDPLSGEVIDAKLFGRNYSSAEAAETAREREGGDDASE